MHQMNLFLGGMVNFMCYMARGSVSPVWLLLASERLLWFAGTMNHMLHLQEEVNRKLKYAQRFLALETTV